MKKMEKIIDIARKLNNKGNYSAILKMLSDENMFENEELLEIYVNALGKRKLYDQAFNYAERLSLKDKFLGSISKANLFLMKADGELAFEFASKAYNLKKDYKSTYAIGAAALLIGNVNKANNHANELLNMKEPKAIAKGFFLQGLIKSKEKTFKKANEYFKKAKEADSDLRIRRFIIVSFVSRYRVAFAFLFTILSILSLISPLSLAIPSLFIVFISLGFATNIYISGKAHSLAAICIAYGFVLLALFVLTQVF